MLVLGLILASIVFFLAIKKQKRNQSSKRDEWIWGHGKLIFKFSENELG